MSCHYVQSLPLSESNFQKQKWKISYNRYTKDNNFLFIGICGSKVPLTFQKLIQMGRKVVILD